VKIHKVYLGTSGGAWPGPKFDAAAEIAKYEKYLAELERKLGDVKFVGGQQVKNAGEAANACAKLANLDTMLISTGKITGIPNYDDRGCRTQLVTEVADARGMLDNWGSGVLEKAGMMPLLHRVVFYGNRLEDVKDLATLMGLKVIEEG